MNSSVLVPLASIISGTILGGLGLYYGQRAHRYPFQRSVHEAQRALLLEAAVIADAIHSRCLELTTAEGQEAIAAARDGLRTEGRHLEPVLAKASVLLPTAVYGAYMSFYGDASRLLRTDSSELKARFTSLNHNWVKLVGPSRHFLGIDTISESNLELFGGGEIAAPTGKRLFRILPSTGRRAT